MGAMSRKLIIFKLRNYVHMGTFFTYLLILFEGNLDEMIVFREGKWLCRVLSTQRFSWRNVRIFRRENWFLLTSSGVIFIWIMETLWIHCHVRKLLRKNALCNQYTVNKRRPVVQRPSRLKSKNSRTPAGWPSQRGTHLSNFNESSILLRRVGVAENFERCEDFLKS